MAPALRFSSLLLVSVSCFVTAAGCDDDGTTGFSDGAGDSGGGGDGSEGGGPIAGGRATGGTGSGGASAGGTSHGGGGGSLASGGTAGNVGGSSGGIASGGTGAAGGSAANAGSGGTAAVGGTAGNAGTSGTGSGGDAGLSGHAGEGGSSGGQPFAGAAGDDSGGEGGVTSPPSVPLTCVYICENDGDCVAGAVCDSARKHCEDPSTVCDSNEACLPALSFWFFNCTERSECGEGEECVDVAGLGYCASTPDAEFGCFIGAALSLPRFRSDGAAVVCGESAARCIAHQCATACDPDTGCGPGLTCDRASGACTCTDVTACGSSPHPSAPSACQ